jgi:hypothetical protein
MKIEVRNVKVAKFASEETLCFEAKVVIDGKVAGSVRNQGHGGCNNYEPRSLFDTLNKHAKTLPDITKYDPPLKMTADLVIDSLVQDYLAEKDYKKTVASRVLCLDNEGFVVETKRLPKGTDVLTVARSFVGRAGIAKVLNLLPEAEALAILKAKRESV